MGWVGLGRRIFDLPDVGLGTYFRQPNQPDNPLGPGNPSGQPYRAGTLEFRKGLVVYDHFYRVKERFKIISSFFKSVYN